MNKFEELEESIKDIKNKLNLPKDLVLPITKSTSREDDKHYKNILSNEQKVYIGRKFNEEILNLGYKF